MFSYLHKFINCVNSLEILMHRLLTVHRTVISFYILTQNWNVNPGFSTNPVATRWERKQNSVYRPPTKMRKCNVVNRVLSFCSRGSQMYRAQLLPCTRPLTLSNTEPCPLPNTFKLGPHYTMNPNPQTCSYLFTMKHVQSLSGWLESYWNTFLLFIVFTLGYFYSIVIVYPVVGMLPKHIHNTR